MNSVRSNRKMEMGLSLGTLLQALAASAALALLICLPASPQGLQLGQISGVVTDQSGGAVAGATVSVVDVARGVTRPLTTDAAGLYSAPGLTAGTYTVRVEAAGFKVLERQNVILGNGDEARVDVTLQPGATNQTVTVTESLPVMNTTNTVLASTLETQQIEDLPINGRLYTHLLDYNPGILGKPGGNSPDYAMNGMGGLQNDWMLDGVEDENEFVNSGPEVGSATSSDELTILPLDAVGEVSILANPTAEYGWELGAHVNVGLKSGTNSIHGTAYAFGRDTSLDAANQYTQSRPDDLFEQYGASIGGPIKKDKLFYFGNYEGMHYTIGAASSAALATSQSLAATQPTNSTTLSLPDAVADLANNAGLTPNPMSMLMAGCTFTGTPGTGTPGTNGFVKGNVAATCDPTKGLFQNGTTTALNFPLATDWNGHSDNQITKVDWHPNDHNAINGEYYFGQAFTLTPNGSLLPQFDNTNLSRTQAMRAVWVFTPNATWVNEARFGWDSYYLADGNADCNGNTLAVNYQALYGFVGGNVPFFGACGFPLVTINGANTLGAANNIADQTIGQHTWHFLDSVSYSHGKHQMKFGGEYHRTIYAGTGTQNAPNGAITFNGGQAFNFQAVGATPGEVSTGLEDFLAGIPQSGSVLEGGRTSHINLDRYAIFIQDDYRATKDVTVNLGLRYEYFPPYAATDNFFGNFNPSAPSGMVQQTGGKALYSTGKTNFGPRLGVSWDVTGKGTTVLRAGASILDEATQIVDVAASGFGGSLDSVPTGYGLYYCKGGGTCNGPNISCATLPCTFQAGAPASANFVQVASPGTDREGVIQLTNQCAVPTTGVGSNSSSCSQIGWTSGQAVFPSGAGAFNCGDGGATIAGLDNLAVTPPSCTMEIYPQHQPTPYLTTWTASVQQAIGNSMSINIAYVGNHLTNGKMEVDLNEPTVGFATTLANSNAGINGTSASCIGPPVPAHPVCAPVPGITSATSRRPYNTIFPYFGNILQYGPGGKENYDGVQIILRRRTSHGLTFNTNYTFAHTLATTVGGNNPTILTITNPNLSYGYQGSPFQHFNVTITYEVPGWKALPLQAAQGWKINTAFEFLSASGISTSVGGLDFAGNGTGASGATHRGSYFAEGYLAPGGSYNNFTSSGFGYVGLNGPRCFTVAGSAMKNTGCTFVGGATGLTYPQICITAATNEPQNAAMNAIDPGISNGLLELNGGTIGGVKQTAYGCWVSTNGLAALLAPAQGTFPNLTKATLQGAPFSEWDLSLTKDTRIKERLTAEFRAEFYNVLNTPVFSGGSGSITSALFGRSTSTPNGANPINGTGGPREVQLGLKLIF
jgi:hypothetical protein